MSRPLNETELWLMNLERERYNVAYRVPAEPRIVETIKTVERPCKRKHHECTKAHATDKRDQMMFNAGRYMAGARDENAVKAHEKLMRELDK